MGQVVPGYNSSHFRDLSVYSPWDKGSQVIAPPTLQTTGCTVHGTWGVMEYDSKLVGISIRDHGVHSPWNKGSHRVQLYNI